MGLSPETVVAANSRPGAGDASSGATATAEPAKRNFFDPAAVGKREYAHPLLHNPGPETTLDPRHGGERDIQRGPDNEQLERSREEFTVLLVGEMEKLLKEYTLRGDTNFNEWIRNNNKMVYLDLFRQLTTNNDQPGAGGEMRHINADAVKTLMADDEGLARIYDVLRREYSDDLAEEGLKGRIHRPSPRPGAMDRRSITLTPGGWGTAGGRALLDFFAKPIGYGAEGRGNPHISRDSLGKVTLTIGGSSVVFASVGMFAGGPLGAAIGAAAPVVYAEIVSAFKPGATYEKDIAPDILHKIQLDADRINWAKRMHGKDPKDFEERDGRIQVREFRSSRTALSKETRRERSDAMMNAIRDYQIANGIPEKYVDVNDIGWIERGMELRTDGWEWSGGGTGRPRRIRRYHPRSPAQHGDLDLTPRVLEIVDVTPRRAGYPPGRGFIEGDIDYNVTLFREVQENLIRQDLDRVFRRVLHKKGYEAVARKRIDERRAMLKSSADVDRRKEELTEQKERVAKDRDTVKGESDTVKSYAERVKKTRKEIGELDGRERALLDRGRVTAGIGGGGVAAGGDFTTAELSDLLTVDGSTVVVTIDDEDIRNLVARRNTLNGAIDARMVARYPAVVDERADARAELATARAIAPGASGPRATAAQERLDRADARMKAAVEAYTSQWEELKESEFSGTATVLERQEKLVSELSKGLTQVQTDRSVKNRELRDRNTADRKSTTETVTAMGTALRTIEGWSVPAAPPAPAIDLSRNALRTETFDALRDRVIDTGRLTAEDMNEPENRKRLSDAMAEARAVVAIEAPLTRLADVTDAAIFNIPEARLLADPATPGNSDAEIEADIIAAAGALPPPAPAALNVAEVGDLRRALRIQRDIDFLSSPTLRMNLADIVAATPDAVRTRIPRLADVIGPFGILETRLLADPATPGNSDAEIEADIAAIVGAVGYAGPPALAVAEIADLRRALRLNQNLDAVSTEATRQLTARQRALDQLVTLTETRIEQAEAAITESGRTPELDVIDSIVSSKNYNRVNEVVRNLPLYREGENGRINPKSIEALLAPGTVTEAMTARAMPGEERFLPAEVGMQRSFARILDELIPRPEGGIPEDFIYNSRRGEAGWIRRNREMITDEMFAVAIGGRFNLRVMTPGAVPGDPWIEGVPVTTYEEARQSLAYRMGMGVDTILPGAVLPPAPDLRVNLITPDDLGGFLSENIWNMMESRIRTADAPLAA